MAFPTFFYLSLNLAIRSSWSEPQSAPGLGFADCTSSLASYLAAKNIIHLISVLTIWRCPCVESSLVLLEEGVCYDQCILLAELLLAFALLHSVLQGQICLLLQVFLDFLLLHSVPYNEKDIFFGGVNSRRPCRSLKNQSTSASSALLVRAYHGITMILNGLPWKWTEIILSFLSLHPSTAFQTLLLTMMAIPFLQRDSCPR